VASRFQQIERDLLQIIEKLKPLDEPEYAEEADEFIDHGEYGLAWGTLIALVNKHIDIVPDETLIQIIRLGRSMEIGVQLSYSL
jgi:hypothetical protein